MNGFTYKPCDEMLEPMSDELYQSLCEHDALLFRLLAEKEDREIMAAAEVPE